VFIPSREPVPPAMPELGPASLRGAGSPLPAEPLDGLPAFPDGPSVLLDFELLVLLVAVPVPVSLVVLPVAEVVLVELRLPAIGALAPVPPLSTA